MSFESVMELIKETEAETHHHALFKGLDKLDERSLDIIQSRWLVDKKATLQELAAKYEVSAERIRQLEAVALKKLKTQQFRIGGQKQIICELGFVQ